MKIVRLIVALMAATPALVIANSPVNDFGAELKYANRALADRNYERAFDEYLMHAEDNGLAQFALGLMEQNGWGRSSDPVAACRWFEKAAHKGIPAAQQFFGNCLAEGVGNEVNGPAAVQWYKTAADQGLAGAACDAGKLFIAGKIVGRDVNQGIALCTAFAQADSTPAMMDLAGLYKDGGVIAQNPVLARFWYNEAAERHVHEAQYRLGLMLGEGQGGGADVVKARFWLEHAAQEGYAPAYLPTAILYANAPLDPKTGALSPEDLAKIYLWTRAAKATTKDPAQLAEISRIEALTLKVMPPQWKPDLDQRVAAHLKKFNETQDAPL